MAWRALILSLVAAAMPLANPTACEASAASATLVVEKTAGDTRSVCVGFDGTEVTVLDLLERSGLPITYQDFGGGSVMVCRIDGVGCDYPRQECMCSFAGKRVFWGMYLRGQDRWTFSQTGAASTVVRDGAVVGWRWGAHDGQDDPPSQPRGADCEAARTVRTGSAGSSGGIGGIGVIAALVIGLVLAAGGLRARRARTAVDA